MIARAALVASLLLSVPLAACGASDAHLVVRQTTDPVPELDHKSHVSPGGFANITLSVRNLGPGPARGVRITELLPRGFQYVRLVTLGGNAIRTSVEDPAAQGDVTWGTWTILPRTSSRESELVLLFRVQVASQPGDYRNRVKVTTAATGVVEDGDVAALSVEPRPSLTVAAAAASGQVATGGTATYSVAVTNTGSAPAKGVAVSVTLPAGFLYASTVSLDGNSTRVEYTDPPQNSLLPVWSSWDIPAASGGSPGLLQITFQSRILPSVPPGTYAISTAVTGQYVGQVDAKPVTRDLPTQIAGEAAPVVVTKGITVPLTMIVEATSRFVPQNGTVVYVITVDNSGPEPARNVIVSDSLPPGFVYSGTNSITLNGQGIGTRLPTPGTAIPQWGPFLIPNGGLNGSTLVILFSAGVVGAAVGPHSNTVSGSSSTVDVTGASDFNPVIVTAG